MDLGATRAHVVAALLAHRHLPGGWGESAGCTCGSKLGSDSWAEHVAGIIVVDLERLEAGYASSGAAAEPDASPLPGEPDPSTSAGVLSSAWHGDHCSSCRTPIIWRRHTGTGKPAPINARPDPTGNVMLVEPDLYAVIGKAGPPAGAEDQPRHTNHFATCPQAGGHHRGA